jgi:hypothetical protein
MSVGSIKILGCPGQELIVKPKHSYIEGVERHLVKVGYDNDGSRAELDCLSWKKPWKEGAQ